MTGPESELQPVSDAVEALLASLRSDETLDLAGEVRAAAALRLAAYLDSGRSGMATAATVKELRDTVTELTKERDDTDRAIAELSARLSTPVQHPPTP